MTESDSFGRALDTAQDIEASQAERWRTMSPEQKARLVVSLSRATIQLAEAGIRARYPTESPRQHFLRIGRSPCDRATGDRVTITFPLLLPP
jgi:hypothetical protein